MVLIKSYCSYHVGNFDVCSKDLVELDPSTYGLTLSEVHSLEGLTHVGLKQGSVEETVKLLKQLYCGPITAEFQHLEVCQCPADQFLIYLQTLDDKFKLINMWSYGAWLGPN